MNTVLLIAWIYLMIYEQVYIHDDVICTFKDRLTLIDLRRDKSLDKSISCLRVQAQGISQALQFRGFLQERFLQTVSACMEVLFDGIQSDFEDRTLFRRKILLYFLRYILRVKYL